jgi:DNA polymerase epsilon subunit 1
MSPNIEGIYETQVPLDFKTVMQLGCIVKPNQKVIPRSEQALGRTYKLSELGTVNSLERQANYLPKASYDKIMFFHISNATRNVLALCMEATKQIQFFVCNSA